MKAFIIGFGFSGATLPLANCLAKNYNYDIDCFYFVYKSKRCNSIESIDFDNSRLKHGVPYLLPNTNKIYKYLDSKVRVYLVPLCANGPEWFHSVSRYINHFIINRFANYILKCKYDWGNLVVHTQLEEILLRHLYSDVKILVSVHEIFETLNSDKLKLKDILKSVNNTGVPIIFHSVSVKTAFDSNIDCRRSDTYFIPFGNFESYSSYTPEIIDGLPEHYLLFIGSIQPYKGLSLLKEALELIDEKVPIVIAGKGFVPELEYFNKRENTYVINRYVENEELVSLVTGCSAIICPYLEASQTGIAPTAFVFGKPIIATNVGAFSEAIYDGKNGYLVNPKNPTEMAKRINVLMSDSKLQNKMKSYILENPTADWNVVSGEYIKIADNL